MPRIFKPTFLACGMVFALAACATQWTKPGQTEADFQTIKRSCDARAAARFPPMASQEISLDQQTAPPKPTMTCTMDNNMMSGDMNNNMMGNACNPMDNSYTPPSVTMVDTNENARAQDARKCLLDNGWQPAKAG